MPAAPARNRTAPRVGRSHSRIEPDVMACEADSSTSTPLHQAARTYYATESGTTSPARCVKAATATLGRDMHPTLRQIDGPPRLLRIKQPGGETQSRIGPHKSRAGANPKGRTNPPEW